MLENLEAKKIVFLLVIAVMSSLAIFNMVNTGEVLKSFETLTLMIAGYYFGRSHSEQLKK